MMTDKKIFIGGDSSDNFFLRFFKKVQFIYKIIKSDRFIFLDLKENESSGKGESDSILDLSSYNLSYLATKIILTELNKQFYKPTGE